jgi:hypothetical protein
MKIYPMHVQSGVDVFRGKNLVNWCIMSAPGHPFLASAMESFVSLIRQEFLGLTMLKVGKWDKFR